jgi:hypothetical protein
MPASGEGAIRKLYGYCDHSGRYGHDCQKRSPCLGQPVEPVRYKGLDGRGKRPHVKHCSTSAPYHEPHLSLACAAGWKSIGMQEYDIHGNKVRDGMNETDEEFWQRVSIEWLEGTSLDCHKKGEIPPNLG